MNEKRKSEKELDVRVLTLTDIQLKRAHTKPPLLNGLQCA